ncbi:MAG: hypothetical protein JJT93_16250, partial [Gammaproteobacteria bacterium]|nr:hypothetical protein [Gammaproteobacteria bacterium]
ERHTGIWSDLRALNLSAELHRNIGRERSLLEALLQEEREHATKLRNDAEAQVIDIQADFIEATDRLTTALEDERAAATEKARTHEVHQIYQRRRERSQRRRAQTTQAVQVGITAAVAVASAGAASPALAASLTAAAPYASAGVDLYSNYRYSKSFCGETPNLLSMVSAGVESFASAEERIQHSSRSFAHSLEELKADQRQLTCAVRHSGREGFNSCMGAAGNDVALNDESRYDMRRRFQLAGAAHESVSESLTGLEELLEYEAYLPSCDSSQAVPIDVERAVRDHAVAALAVISAKDHIKELQQQMAAALSQSFESEVVIEASNSVLFDVSRDGLVLVNQSYVNEMAERDSRAFRAEVRKFWALLESYNRWASIQLRTAPQQDRMAFARAYWDASYALLKLAVDDRSNARDIDYAHTHVERFVSFVREMYLWGEGRQIGEEPQIRHLFEDSLPSLEHSGGYLSRVIENTVLPWTQQLADQPTSSPAVVVVPLPDASQLDFSDLGFSAIKAWHLHTPELVLPAGWTIDAFLAIGPVGVVTVDSVEYIYCLGAMTVTESSRNRSCGFGFHTIPESDINLMLKILGTRQLTRHQTANLSVGNVNYSPSEKTFIPVQTQLFLGFKAVDLNAGWIQRERNFEFNLGRGAVLSIEAPILKGQ